MPNKVKITSTVHLNLDRIYEAVMDDSFKTEIVNHLIKSVQNYVPYDTGDLQDSAQAFPDYIYYRGPYAHYQWEGKNLTTGGHLHYNQTEHAPKATDHWFDVYMDMEGDAFIKWVRDEARKRLKGG